MADIPTGTDRGGPHGNPAWPAVSWDAPPRNVAWLAERTGELASHTRAFEAALEMAAAAGEAELSRATDELSRWEHEVANVFLYVGLGDASQVNADDVPVHAEELAKVCACLASTRAAILERLGPAGAARVREREAAARVTEAQIRDRVGELPSFAAPVDVLGAPGAAAPAPWDAEARPVTPQELQKREAADAKELPDPPDFKPLLAALPSVWVSAIFESLGLALAEDAEADDLSVSAKAPLQRQLILDRLPQPEFLREVVFALADEDRALLGELLAGGGALRHGEVIARHGKDDADGFYWGDRPPSGPLARLRRTGLAYVGRARGKPTVVVPTDLREALGAILNAAGG